MSNEDAARVWASHNPYKYERRKKKSVKKNARLYRARRAAIRQRKDKEKVSDNKYRLSMTSRTGLGHLRIAGASGDPEEDTHYLHELKKFQIAYILKTWGYIFATEAEFTDGRRADVYILDGKSDNGAAIEAETNQGATNVVRKKFNWSLPCLVVDPAEDFNTTRDTLKDWMSQRVTVGGEPDGNKAEEEAKDGKT